MPAAARDRRHRTGGPGAKARTATRRVSLAGRRVFRRSTICGEGSIVQAHRRWGRPSPGNGRDARRILAFTNSFETTSRPATGSAPRATATASSAGWALGPEVSRVCLTVPSGKPAVFRTRDPARGRGRPNSNDERMHTDEPPGIGRYCPWRRSMSIRRRHAARLDRAFATPVEGAGDAGRRRSARRS